MTFLLSSLDKKSQFSITCTSILYQTAIFRKLFPHTKLNLYHELYNDLPETNIADKIIKLRKMNNLEREELASLLGLHVDTINRWEVHNIMPQPENIKRICDFFKASLSYFDKYYSIYYSNYTSTIKMWKVKNNYTYSSITAMLNVSHSGLARLINKKINLSYDMYLKLKKLKVF